MAWKKTGQDVVLAHCPRHEEFGLYYARIYTSQGGFSYSPTNQLIINLKKSPRSSEPELWYKKQAINAFADELGRLLNRNADGDPVNLVPVPCSKSLDDPEYDDRVERVLHIVAQNCARARYLPLLKRLVSVDAAHARREQRDPLVTYNSVAVVDGQTLELTGKEIFYLVDDVLTSGATFEGCRRKIMEFYPECHVSGIFWAKSEWMDPKDLL